MYNLRLPTLVKSGWPALEKSGKIREFPNPVFKSGKVRRNQLFWRNSGYFIMNQGKIREFRYKIYELLF